MKPINKMVSRNALEDVREVGLRIDAVEFRGLDNGC